MACSIVASLVTLDTQDDNINFGVQSLYQDMSLDLQVPELRILSVVEALSVTGPVKPLLAFAALPRAGSADQLPLGHTVVTTRRESAAQSWYKDKLYLAAKAVGLECFMIPERRAFDFRVLREMARLIERVNPNIVETHDYKSHFMLFSWRLRGARSRGVKWIAFHHGYTRTSWKVRLYQQLDRLTLRHADHVITVCKPFALELQRRGVRPRRLSVITNTVAARPAPSLQSVASLRESLGIDPGEQIVLCVGRLSREKGQQDLISAFQRLLGMQPEGTLRLLVVGDGPDRERLEKLAEPFRSRVLFTGEVADPWPFFHAAQVFALPSHSEGSPLVVLEAMAAGVPIVATTVGGIPETLRDRESALLVPAGDPEALCAGIGALLGDRALRQRLVAAASAAMKNLTPCAYARRLLAIYARVMQEA